MLFKMFSTNSQSKLKKIARPTYMSRANNEKNKPTSILSKLKELFFEFCETTKISGVFYLGRSNTSAFER